MKILHVTGARGWGGNEQQLVDVIPELNKVNVESIIFGVENSVLHKYAIEHMLNFISCKEEKLNKPKNYKHLSIVVKNIRPSLIHLHTSDSVTIYTISDLLFKLKTPTVFSKKGISRKMSFLSQYKYNYKNINKILCVSQVVKDHFKEVISLKNHDKLCVVYDGVKVTNDSNNSSEDIQTTYQLDKDVQIIGNIANHNGAKDLPTLIKTLHVLVNEKQIKDIHLLQIGAFTGATSKLKKLVVEYQLEDYITFTDFKDNAASLLYQFDVFLMTSIREGGPTSVLEAFYKKVPVVSTRVGVVSEAIEDGINGFIAEVEDYNALADKIEIILKDESLKNSFKEISYKKFLNNFTTEKLGEKTYKVYQEVLAKH